MTGDLKTAIRSLIVNNADLHRRVLVYEPIFLDEFMAMLKANGVKSKVNDVMDYLDEQVIVCGHFNILLAVDEPAVLHPESV